MTFIERVGEKFSWKRYYDGILRVRNTRFDFELKKNLISKSRDILRYRGGSIVSTCSARFQINGNSVLKKKKKSTFAKAYSEFHVNEKYF